MDSIHDIVTLIPWQESWADSFKKEKRQIEETVRAVGISAKVYHVGSTSVKGMISKPVIDILVCPSETASLDATANALSGIGYANLGECGRPGRYFLSKGDRPNEAFYLHLCHRENQVAKDQLLFQKLERSDPEVFQDYINIKRVAAELFPDDRYAYREMKGWFIDAVLAAARSAEREHSADDRIKYWIYEIEMSDEANQCLKKQLELCEMTLDEYAEAVMRHMIDNPEETRSFSKELGVDSDEPSEIHLIRFYPVYKGETEAQAKRRKLAEEADTRHSKPLL